MQKKTLTGSLALAGLAVLGLFRLPIASADTGSFGGAQSTTAQTLPGDTRDSSDNSSAVYDVGPAAAQAAMAKTEYDRAYSDYYSNAARVRQEFYASNDYRDAVKAMEDARADYDAARDPIVDSVQGDLAYRMQIEKRTRVELALRAKGLSAQDVIDLATKKMEYSAQANSIVADAINKDSGVQTAKTKLEQAQQTLDAKRSQFEASLYRNPIVVASKQSLDSAKNNLAAAQAYYQGAMLARSDAIDADQRRYASEQNNFVNPYPNYNYGYNGWGYGSGFIVIRNGGGHGHGGHN